MYKIFPTVFHCLIYNWYMFFELENTYLLILKTNVANISKQEDDPDTIKQELIIKINSLNNPELKKALNRRPDLFPIILVIFGAGILTICSLYVQIPPEMRWVLFITLLVIYTPIILALDYWGFEAGIKSIKRVR